MYNVLFSQSNEGAVDSGQLKEEKKTLNSRQSYRYQVKFPLLTALPRCLLSIFLKLRQPYSGSIRHVTKEAVTYFREWV